LLVWAGIIDEVKKRQSRQFKAVQKSGWKNDTTGVLRLKADRF